jgi:hypothetical protein
MSCYHSPFYCPQDGMDNWYPLSQADAGLLQRCQPPKPPVNRGPPVMRGGGGPPPAPAKKPRTKILLQSKADQQARQHGGWKPMKTADGGEYYLNIDTKVRPVKECVHLIGCGYV